MHCCALKHHAVHASHCCHLPLCQHRRLSHLSHQFGPSLRASSTLLLHDWLLPCTLPRKLAQASSMCGRVPKRARPAWKQWRRGVTAKDSSSRSSSAQGHLCMRVKSEKDVLQHQHAAAHLHHHLCQRHRLLIQQLILPVHPAPVQGTAGRQARHAQSVHARISHHVSGAQPCCRRGASHSQARMHHASCVLWHASCAMHACSMTATQACWPHSRSV